MSLVTTSREELVERYEDAFRRFVELVHEVPPDTPLPKSEWTAGEVAVHVLSVYHRYNHRDFRSHEGLSPSVSALNQQNDRELEALQGLSRLDVTDRLKQESDAFLAQGLPVEDVYPFHLSQEIDGYGAYGNLLAELLVHGYDVAKAAGHPWPISNRDSLLILNALVQISAGAIDTVATSSVDAIIELRPRGGNPQRLRISHGSASVGDASTIPGRADVILGGPATPMMFNLFGRFGLVASAVRGVGVRGGRRPWLALRIEGWIDRG